MNYYNLLIICNNIDVTDTHNKTIKLNEVNSFIVHFRFIYLDTHPKDNNIMITCLMNYEIIENIKYT